MNMTLTIRDLDEPVQQLLRLQAASHQRSIEAEARDILTRAVTQNAASEGNAEGLVTDAAENAVASVRGMWQGRGSTGEMMHALRGED